MITGFSKFLYDMISTLKFALAATWQMCRLCLSIAVIAFYITGCEKDDLVAIRSIETAEPVIMGTTAVTGGIMIANREIELIDYGVVFNTTENPSVEDNVSQGTDLQVSADRDRYSAEFKSQISPLIPGTVFYIRAYVTTLSGTAYGNQVSFSTN